MASHKSAEKANRQAERRHAANSRNRSRLKTQIRKLRRAVEAGKGDEAKALLTPTVALIDRSVNLGVLHRNTAARRKSRLTRNVARLG
jgi:small subunit ribosomal protein S20